MRLLDNWNIALIECVSEETHPEFFCLVDVVMRHLHDDLVQFLRLVTLLHSTVESFEKFLTHFYNQLENNARP